MYFRKETYKTDQILKNYNYQEFDLDGDKIKPSSRYALFKDKGIKCIKCGISGSFIAKECNLNLYLKGINSFHLNLYAITRNGDEVLMTKDHIIPKSKGGENSLSNYQVMCQKCNLRKGNKL